MMDAVRLFLRNFIKYFFYIAVFAQIVTGTVYLVCNFTEYIVYPETEEMIHVARGLLFDEYTGVLYPLFIRVCLGFQQVFGIGYYLVVHLLQLVLFTVTAGYMIKGLLPGKRIWVLVAYIVSFPICMQTILMVSPMAFKTIFAFMMIGAMVRLTKRAGSISSWLILFTSYILAALNVPDDLYVWIVPIGVWGIILFFNQGKQYTVWKRCCVLLIMVMVFLGTFFALDVTTEAGVRGRMQKTVSSVLFQRTLWPKLIEKYTFLPEEMCEIIDADLAARSDSSAESITCLVGPKIDNAVGYDKANKLYTEAFFRQLEYNKRALFKAVWDDFIGYLLTPYSIINYMLGQEGAAFSSLYGMMSEKNPIRVYQYFSISLISVFLLALGGILSIIRGRFWVKKSFKRTAVFFAGVLGYQALWYAVVNVPGVDYRYGLLNVAVFSTFSLYPVFAQDGKPVYEKTQRKWKNNKKIRGVIAGVFFVIVALGIVRIVLKNDYKESDLLSGKTIVCLGDSIWGSVKDETGIASMVEKMTGATVVNYAISGSAASKVEGAMSEDAVRNCTLVDIIDVLSAEKSENEGLKHISQETFEEADYLVLAYGLNDYFQGAPALGDDKSYESTLNYAVDFFKEKYPHLQIVLIGQTYCQFYGYGIVQEDSNTRDFGGGVGTDYVKAAGTVAANNHLIFINQYEQLPINEWNGLLYLVDGTHLTPKGRKEYAGAISECLIRDYEERNIQ